MTKHDQAVAPSRSSDQSAESWIASVDVPDFDRLYDEQRDPWQVGSSWYEQRKIAVVLSALAEPRYSRAIDPACGTGHLARALAGRCDEVVARDASAPAIETARAVCVSSANVDLGIRALPYADGPPTGPFDLVVLSEFLYYLRPGVRRSAVTSVLDRADDRVEVVAVHWRDRPEDAITTGEAVHEELREVFRARAFRHQVAHFDEEYVLDVFTRGHNHYSA